MRETSPWSCPLSNRATPTTNEPNFPHKRAVGNSSFARFRIEAKVQVIIKIIYLLMENKESEIKTVSSATILMWWGISIFLLIIGFGEQSVGLILAGVILLPITNSLSKKYLNLNLSVIARVLTAIILVGIISIVTSSFNYASQKAQENTVTESIDVSTVFDVPSLVGKDIVGLTEELGTPNKNTEPTGTYKELSDVRTWEKIWEKDGYSLMATYDIDTKKVIDLFLGSDSDASLIIFRNTNNILKVGNLVTDSPDYSIEFVKLKAILGSSGAGTPQGYTGAIIRQTK